MAVLGLGALAGALMLISLFSTIASVDVANSSCEVINDANPDLAERCVLSGFERHSIAFLLLGLLAWAMAYGVARGRSRPAAWGLLAVGAIAVALALLVDLPVTDDTGAIGRDFEGATASAGTGLWIELVGGLLALAAGGLALRATRVEPAPRRRDRRARLAGPRQGARTTGREPGRVAAEPRDKGNRVPREDRASRGGGTPRSGAQRSGREGEATRRRPRPAED
jgi:hypothetical protein